MRLFLAAALVVIAFGYGASAGAETLRQSPSCYDGLGDIWSVKSETTKVREIDGNTIKNINDFARMTGTRELGIKLIKGGNFAGWDFTNLPLHQICFEESDLKGSNFSEAEGTGVGFIKSDLTGANMQGAVMPRVMFRNANLTDVNASNANFQGGHFDGGWFEGKVAGWNLNDATMTEFVFECGITLDDGCPVSQGGDPISAKGADFSGATLHSFGLYSIKLDGAVLANTTIGPAQLPQLAKAEFRGDIVLRGADQDVVISPDQAQAMLAAHGEQKLLEARPSFDCAKASTKVEAVICEEYASDLRAMDRDIAALYKQVRAIDGGVKRSQLAWLKTRDACADLEYPSDCVSQSYSKRKGQLLGLVGNKNWLKLGQAAYFVDEVLSLTPAFKQTELYQKITPALAGASRSEILVQRQQDGLYSIKGFAVGANAHLCSLGASHLYFDKQTGWYIPVSEDAAMPIFRIYNGRLEVFENGRPDYEKHPDAWNFMSCGMRASFGEVIRVEADAEQLQKVRKSLDTEL